jgi:hypothetical protein
MASPLLTLQGTPVRTLNLLERDNGGLSFSPLPTVKRPPAKLHSEMCLPPVRVLEFAECIYPLIRLYQPDITVSFFC